VNKGLLKIRKSEILICRKQHTTKIEKLLVEKPLILNKKTLCPPKSIPCEKMGFSVRH